MSVKNLKLENLTEVTRCSGAIFAGLIVVIYVGVECLCGLDQGWQTLKRLDMKHFRLCRPYCVTAPQLCPCRGTAATGS